MPNFLANVISLFYKIWCKTIRFQYHGIEHVENLVKNNQTFILAGWHSEIFSTLYAKEMVENIKLVAIVSPSKDGEILSLVLNKLGFRVSSGSSSRGGLKALIQTSKFIKNEGFSACISVDGPRGPRYEVKEGVFFLAHKLNIPIIPLKAVMTKGKIFNSWDKFELPYPFTKVNIYLNTPYYIQETELTSEILKKESNKLKVILEESCNK
ncbi:lysophospholipid acyltransferase family protein [Desulfovibrio litoralis]|uniref:DUF374 domain-containing protein n=1 Tax=Desulfovibrio litoralis DSM 11393 TaxID=1121455 RepID=A0A1M7SXG7_9BACT|nr:DUF374 domain-containing protein [Desulfovibrio litoralis]SHN63088.1 hypothetical protein SAMN02745728_01338 [Desulfovibrio litoralis DSM 11393]